MTANNSIIVCSGGLFLARDTKRFLFLLRSQTRSAGTWGVVGGKQEPQDHTPYDTLCREIKEEIGRIPAVKKTVPLELFVSPDLKFHYNTYVLIVEREFIPILNQEHSGYSWCNYKHWPKPLHQGVRTSLTNKSNLIRLETILELL